MSRRFARRERITELDAGRLVMVGLRSGTIVESPIPVSFDGKPIGNYQGIEFYSSYGGAVEAGARPQIAVDLVSNFYFRGTYHVDSASTATFGVSVVGAPSLRTSDGVLHLPPTARLAEIALGSSGKVTVTVRGTIDGIADITSERHYSRPSVPETVVAIRSTLVTKKRVVLDSALLGRDAVRLLSISSMFSSSGMYDTDVLKADHGEASTSFALDSVMERGIHLPPPPHPLACLSALRRVGSLGKRGTPGAPDSPSVRIDLTECSIAGEEIGFGAYLARTTDRHADSLSAWFEWRDAPPQISEGTMIASSFRCTFFGWKEDGAPG